MLLAGGPGAGKTFGLRALATADPARTVVWLSCDEEDADPTTFLLDLAGAFARAIPDFAPLPGDDARAPWFEIFRRLAAYGTPPLDLVLDDAHHAFAADPERWAALARAVPRFPEGFRVLVSTARPLAPAMARWEAQGLARSLGPDALAFTPDEVTAFLAAQVAADGPPLAWQERAKDLDGWPLGLALVATGAAPSRDDPMSNLVLDVWLGDLPPDELDRLGQAAALGDLDPEALRDLLGADRPAAWLARWREAFLIVPFGADYRLASPLVEPLRERFRASTPADQRAAWHERAGSWYRARGDAPRAITHLLDAGAWDTAAAALHEAGPALAAGGRFVTLERWLAAFPAACAAEDPRLRYWTGQAHYFRGRADEALVHYEAARRGFDARGRTADATKAVVRAMTIAALSDDLRTFQRLAVRVQALPGEARAEDIADTLLLRAMVADRHADPALMEECNRAVLVLSDPGNVELEVGRCIARANLFTLDWQRGDLASAREHAREAVDRAEEAGRPAIALSARFLLAHLDLVEGLVENVTTLAAGLPTAWEELLDWHDRAVAWIVLGRQASAVGDNRRAEQEFARAERLFKSIGVPEGRLVALEARLWHMVTRGQVERALALVVTEPPGPPTHFYDAVVHIPATWALVLADRAAEAAAAWPALIEALEALGASYHVALARVLEARTVLAMGDVPGAARAAAALGPAVARYPFLGTWLDPISRATAEMAPSAEMVPSIATSSVDSHAATTPAGPASPSPAGPPAPLALQLFGTFDVTMEGRRLDAWPRRKAKWMLAALAFHPRGLDPWGAAEVLDDPGLTADRGNPLRVAIRALRRVLEPALDKGEESAYVAWDGRTYALRADAPISVDLWRFDELAVQGEMLAPRQPDEAALIYTEALELVRGEVLDEPGCHERFHAERERVHARVLAMIAFLAARAEARKEPESLFAWHERAAAFAPTDTDAVLARLACYERHGWRDRARRTYWDHRQALKARLGVTPDAEVESAYLALRD